MRTCETCQSPIVQEPGEDKANFKRRTVCRTKACRDVRNLKRQHRNEKARKRKEAKEPYRKKFAGRATSAVNAFLRGGKHGQTS